MAASDNDSLLHQVIKTTIRVGNLVKKVFDILDDIIFTLKEVFSPIVGKIAYSGALGLVNVFEFIEGITKFKKAYDDRGIRQRNSRMAGGVLSSTLAFAGLGLSTTVLLDTVNVISIPSFLVETVFTPLIPGLLGVIYLGNLALRSYMLHNIKKDAKKAKDAYEAYVSQLKFDHLNKTPGLSAFNQIGELIHPEKLSYEEVTNLNELFEDYRKTHEKKVKAEKKVGFAVVELLTSMVVITGVTLAALGVAMAFPPAILIYVGVGVAFSAKVFEFFDDHSPVKAFKDWRRARNGLSPTPRMEPGRFTRPLRNYFRNLFNLTDDKVKKLIEIPDYVPPPYQPQKVEVAQPQAAESISATPSLSVDIPDSLYSRDDSPTPLSPSLTPLPHHSSTTTMTAQMIETKQAGSSDSSVASSLPIAVTPRLFENASRVQKPEQHLQPSSKGCRYPLPA